MTSNLSTYVTKTSMPEGARGTSNINRLEYAQTRMPLILLSIHYMDTHYILEIFFLTFMGL